MSDQGEWNYQFLGATLKEQIARAEAAEAKLTEMEREREEARQRVETLSHSLVAALERAERAEVERDKALAALNAYSG